MLTEVNGDSLKVALSKPLDSNVEKSANTTSSEPNDKEVEKKMMLKLEAADGTVIEVEKDVAFKSILIKGMITDLQINDPDDVRLQDPIPVLNVSGKLLEKIMEYCIKYRDIPVRIKTNPDEDPRFVLNQWEWNYTEMPLTELVELISAASYLDIPGLFDITTQKVANMADDKTVEELREIFSLENDWTPEEEEEMRERFAWCEFTDEDTEIEEPEEAPAQE